MSNLGPRPQGDPAAMRTYAAWLRSTAGDVKSGHASAAGCMDGACFVGPQGDRIRGRLEAIGHRGTSMAAKMTTLAGEIARRAGEIEHAQHAWDQAKKHADAQAREQRQAAH